MWEWELLPDFAFMHIGVGSCMRWLRHGGRYTEDGELRQAANDAWVLRLADARWRPVQFADGPVPRVRAGRCMLCVARGCLACAPAQRSASGCRYAGMSLAGPSHARCSVGSGGVLCGFRPGRWVPDGSARLHAESAEGENMMTRRVVRSQLRRQDRQGPP